ncbi:MAG: lipocalin-like domain-containing protein [Pseudomonadota bacterium]
MHGTTRRQHLQALGLALLAPGAARAQPAFEGVRPRALVFPRDHGAHPDTRTEWWYVTGSLAAEDHSVFGFQVTFFRSRTEVPRDHPSRFAARQLLFAHAALTDLPQQRLRHDQRIARAGFGIAEAAQDDTRVVLRDWRFERREGEHGSLYRAQVDSRATGFTLDLELAATQPLLLQGTGGFSRKGPLPSQASHYVSEPQLRVAGTLRRDGRSARASGRAWLDHEWSETYMPAGAVGWDWIGMNLDDGSALMAFRLRTREGGTLWGGGSLRRPGQPARVFEGEQAVLFTAGRHWTSPATGIRYPVQWQVSTPAGRFEVRALLDAQELDSRNSTGTVYWEGLSDLLDDQGRRIGRGYLEMTGYAGGLRI